ncbi:unnamed protein product [Prunus armeniaca]|uniref:Uncharacterized protein n=1 Tax=Prunus armeniaca TaxID=36596 RepID=A0A6J5W2N8_PRUAR|nr:unnamed protein product [Prunus armeniaca]CAB4294004.1 unnamed protein product [Prunus armeniaca]
MLLAICLRSHLGIGNPQEKLPYNTFPASSLMEFLAIILLPAFVAKFMSIYKAFLIAAFG